MHSLAEQVRRRRLERDWTLDAAAVRLGISRRLLAQIEAGDANPALSSLLAVATGFEITLAELLAGPETPTIVVQLANATAPVLWTGPDGGSGRLLVASEGLELWDWVLEPGEERRSEAHRPGAREALTVTAGTIALAIADDVVMLTRGQSAAFAADIDHTYSNPKSKAARFTLAVHDAS